MATEIERINERALDAYYAMAKWLAMSDADRHQSYDELLDAEDAMRDVMAMLGELKREAMSELKPNDRVRHKSINIEGELDMRAADTIESLRAENARLRESVDKYELAAVAIMRERPGCRCTIEDCTPGECSQCLLMASMRPRSFERGKSAYSNC